MTLTGFLLVWWPLLTQLILEMVVAACLAASPLGAFVAWRSARAKGLNAPRYALLARIRDLVPSGREPLISRVGPAVGSHAGPGALGIAMLRSSAE